ncbi:thioredoxin domain-containing protein [Sphingomonas sp. BAUL-RG-20F-R05-02]|uniref:thioredoxin domain-containing protein n=1 Tax=Sphingomonas sp. BAUL-RG-20F-R05-02 TaxID=2914830 RepID=UPI001F5626BE|nr:thioredoxin domain-containing protein [Sphingomonas sp. BAUL-RG-20F-R05-02]
MKRWLFALLVLVGLATALPAVAAPDWSKVATKTATGSYVIGNPKAKVKLVEYLSYTCPHCAAFSKESAATLKGQFVKSGSVSVELRNAVRDRADLAAAQLARCAGPAGFSGATEAIFAAQDTWLPEAIKYSEFNAARIASYPINVQLQKVAAGAGLDTLMRARGMSQAAFDACFADTTAIDAIAKMSDASWQAIHATPSFLLNGAAYDYKGWPDLEKALRAAGAH